MASEGSSGSKAEPAAESKAFLPRWVLWVAMPGLLMPVGIVAFMAVAQLAHDEQRCPFEQRSVQELGGGARVLEEARQCMPDTEERRYRLQRGDTLQVLGERRFAREAFADGKYSWKASINDRHEVQIIVHSADHGDVMFREGTAAEHAGGPLEPPRR